MNPAEIEDIKGGEGCFCVIFSKSLLTGIFDPKFSISLIVPGIYVYSSEHSSFLFLLPLFSPSSLFF